MISKATIDQILSTANISDVIGKFENLFKSGKDEYCQCPECGKMDKKKKKGLMISRAKNVCKCFSCDKGYNSISYLTEVQKMDYPEALRWLSVFYNITIEEIEKPKGPQKKNKKDAQKSFLVQQMESSGLTVDDLKVNEKVDHRTTNIVHCFKSGTIDQYGRVVTGDDMIIEYHDLEGLPITYQKPKSQKFENLYRVRWQFPDQHTDKDGRPMKYKSPYGSGSHLFIPEIVRQIFKDKRIIKRLYVHEGEKKALKACKHGMISVGIMGIHNLANNGKLPHELQMIIQTCMVEEIIFVVDSDWDKLGNNLKAGDRVDLRPRSFFYAIKNFRDYFRSFANNGIYLETYFASIKNDFNEKGIDDLLAGTLKEKEIELSRDFENSINNIKTKNGEGKYINLIKITSISENKLEELWGLQSAETFAAKYKEDLKDIPTFKIGKYIWRFKQEADETNTILELAQPLVDDEMYFCPEKRFDKKGNEYTVYKFEWLYAYNFLKRRGYGRLMLVNGAYILSHLEGKIVSTCEAYQVKDFVMGITKEIAPKQDMPEIMNMLYRGGKMYFGPDSLSNLDFINVDFKFSAIDYQYMFFKDKFWKVNENGIEEKPMNELDCHVWDDKIHSFDAKQITNNFIEVERITEQMQNKLQAKTSDELPDLIGKYDVIISDEAKKCHFLQFLLNTSDFYWHKWLDLNREPLKEDQRSLEEKFDVNMHFMAKLTAFGYFCHKFFDPANTKAIIGMDGKDTEVGESNGGTGKSLFGDAVAKIASVIKVSGKNRKITEDPFWAEEVNEKTDAIIIDDCRNNIDFEFFFPYITGNFVVNPKGKARFTLPKNLTPKFYFTTNGAVNGEGSSFRRRQSYIVFSDYYTDEYTPVHEFGTRFFDEWDGEQWNLFYNLAAYAIHLYFKFGLIEPPREQVKSRTTRQFIGEEFLTWADEYFSEKINEFYAHLNTKLTRHEVYETFLSRNQQQKKFTTPTRFKKKIIAYCHYREYLFNPETGGKDDKSGGIEYFSIYENQKENK